MPQYAKRRGIKEGRRHIWRRLWRKGRQTTQKVDVGGTPCLRRISDNPILEIIKKKHDEIRRRRQRQRPWWPQTRISGGMPMLYWCRLSTGRRTTITIILRETESKYKLGEGVADSPEKPTTTISAAAATKS